MADETFEITGRPRILTMAVAALVSLLGMVMLWGTSEFQWGTVGLIMGIAGVLIGALAVVASLQAARKASVVAQVSASGLALVSNGTSYVREWKDIAKVTMAGNALAIHQQDGQRLTIVAPPGSSPQQLDALAHALATHLDADRGYRPFA